MYKYLQKKHWIGHFKKHPSYSSLVIIEIWYAHINSASKSLFKNLNNINENSVHKTFKFNL